jgi:hypothetical protein
MGMVLYMGPYAGVNYNPTLCPLQSWLQNIYHGQPYARVDFIPQSGTLDLASVGSKRACVQMFNDDIHIYCPAHQSTRVLLE